MLRLFFKVLILESDIIQTLIVLGFDEIVKIQPVFLKHICFGIFKCFIFVSRYIFIFESLIT